MSDYTFKDQKTNLIINKMSKQTYNDFVLSSMINDDELYFVEEDQIDGNSDRIINVGEPLYNSDAATKNYVDANTAVKLDLSAVGMPNGTASLDAAGKLPLSQLPDTINSPHNHYKSEIVDFDHIHSKQDIADFEHTHKMDEITGLIEELDSIKFNEEEIFITEED